MFNITGRIFIGNFKGNFFAYLSIRLTHIRCVHYRCKCTRSCTQTCIKKTQTSMFCVQRRQYGCLMGHIRTLYGFWSTDPYNPPVTISICVHPSPPPSIMPSQCMVWGRNRVVGMLGCVVCNHRSLPGPVAIMCNSQIKVQPEDSAGRPAALCYLIAGSWVSHVKWQTGKCEIPDKAQSPKKPWSSSNEESDGV